MKILNEDEIRYLQKKKDLFKHYWLAQFEHLLLFRLVDQKREDLERLSIYSEINLSSNSFLLVIGGLLSEEDILTTIEIIKSFFNIDVKKVILKPAENRYCRDITYFLF